MFDAAVKVCAVAAVCREETTPNAVPVMTLVLAAGIFTGIMTDAGMIKAMANALAIGGARRIARTLPSPKSTGVPRPSGGGSR